MHSECPYCGMVYDNFRTGLKYRDVREMFWVESDDPQEWRYKRRHTILGKWRQIKQEMWEQHIADCEHAEDAGYAVNDSRCTNEVEHGHAVLP